MTDKKPNVETLFHEALQIESTEERLKFIREACGDDSNLFRQIETMLAANSEMQSQFLEATRGEPGESVFSDQVGTTIGPYKLLTKIGSGGMGVVFIAEQVEPVKRQVALKIIKPGMDSKEVMARFAAERQALAMMDHPNIARVLDAGETDRGHPYFVMELVKGESITEFADLNRLSSDERLELFVNVCHAIQHAHQKGVIHRDIKPSNVLVSRQDGKPIVKVIDFGVAKAIDKQLTEQTVLTQFAQVIGTPLYMSPEQAGMSSLDIDTRTDIYSLGVLLYELLTGYTPFDRSRMKKAAFDEMRKIIREEDPPRPSTRISTIGDSASTVGNNRQTEPRKLQQWLKGDIDWIVMKALEKDRTRRYETANGFAMDVQRFLNQEPVLACPPSAAYRVKKFIRRNRAGVIATSLVLAALVLGLIGTGLGFIWAVKEKNRADASAEVAATKEKTTRRILEFFTDLFEEANPEKRLGEPMTVEQFLDLGANRIDELASEPDTMATLKETIGSLYVRLGDYEKSQPLLEWALDYRKGMEESSVENKVAFANVATSLAELYQWTDPVNAEKLAREASDAFDQHLGDSPELADSLNVLGNSLQRQNKIEEAITVHERSLAIRRKFWPPGHPKHSNVATALHNIGICYFYENELEQAETYYLQAIAIDAAVLPADDPGLATGKHVLSIVYANQSKFENAKKWQQEAFDTRKKVFPPDHDHVGLSCNWMGNILRGLGMYDESEPLLRQALKIHLAAYGEEHGLVYWDRECLLKTLVKLKKFDEAMELHKTLLGSDSSEDGFANRRSVNLQLGEILRGQGKKQEAQKTWLETTTLYEDPKKPNDGFGAQATLKLMPMEIRDGKPFSKVDYEGAVRFLIQHEKWSENDVELQRMKIDIADALFSQGNHQSANSIYEDVIRQNQLLVTGESIDPFLLNFVADCLLNFESEERRDADKALELAKRVNENVDVPSPHYVSTLARAHGALGQKAKAISLQQTANEMLPSDSFWREEFEKRLATLESSDASHNSDLDVQN